MFYAPTPRCYNGCGNAGGKNDDFIRKTHPQAISGPGFIRKNTTADLSHATWLGERTKAMGPVWLQPYDTAHAATMPGADCWGCLVPLTEPLCTAHPSPFCPQGVLPAWDLPEEGKELEASRNPQQRCHEQRRQHVHAQG